MKDTGDLFSKICDMDNLRKAHKNAKRGKGWYAEVKCIEKDLDHYLRRLQENLIEHRYHTSEYEIFTKKESNKEIGAIKELATEVKYMRGDLNETVERLNKLEGKDGDKWDKFKWLIVTGLVTLILGYLAVSVGLK